MIHRTTQECYIFYSSSKMKIPIITYVKSNCKIKSFNNESIRALCKTCPKFTIKTRKQRHWRRFGVFIVNFEQILHIVLVFPLLILNKKMPTVMWWVTYFSEIYFFFSFFFYKLSPIDFKPFSLMIQ